MFQIEQKNIVNADYALIKRNYFVHHFDEFPILFSGTNRYGNKIVGSLTYEDPDTDLFRYIHVITDNKNYLLFLKRRLSYRELIEQAENVFILDKNINDQVISQYILNYREIPDDYLPLASVYCPNSEAIVGEEFSFSLGGLIADVQEAFVDQVNKVTSAVERIYGQAKNSIRLSNLDVGIRQLASSEGSFRINFRIKSEAVGIFPIDTQSVNRFITNYVSYALNDLNDDIEKIVSRSDNRTRNEIPAENLLQELNSIYLENRVRFTNEDKENFYGNLLDTTKELKDISDQLGMGFSEIEVIVIDSSNDEHVIGLIDEEFSEQIDLSVELIPTEVITEIAETEVEYNHYTIHVKALNLGTRNGSAEIVNFIDESVIDIPHLSIDGDEELDGSIFTSSMHTKTWIGIHAKAKIVSGHYKHLYIKFE